MIKQITGFCFFFPFETNHSVEFFFPIQLSRPTERGNDGSKKSKERRKADTKKYRVCEETSPNFMEKQGPMRGASKNQSYRRAPSGLFFPAALCTSGSRQTCFWPAPKLEPCIFFYFNLPPVCKRGPTESPQWQPPRDSAGTELCCSLYPRDLYLGFAPSN